MPHKRKWFDLLLRSWLILTFGTEVVVLQDPMLQEPFHEPALYQDPSTDSDPVQYPDLSLDPAIDYSQPEALVDPDLSMDPILEVDPVLVDPVLFDNNSETMTAGSNKLIKPEPLTTEANTLIGMPF